MEGFRSVVVLFHAGRDQGQKRLMDPKILFYRKDGSLTRYAFSCGYVQKYGDGIVQLWKEHFCYHILTHSSEGQITRSTTDSLTEARRIYAAYVRAAKGKRG